MKKEKSCGCIIINDNKVLLVYEKNQNFWGFPKGHVEKNEKEIETAIREVKEEVGLEVDIQKGKRYEFKYKIGNDIEKTCVLFIAYPKTYNIKNQESEIANSNWYSFDDAINTLSYENLKEILKKVIKDINNKKSTN